MVSFIGGEWGLEGGGNWKGVGIGRGWELEGSGDWKRVRGILPPLLDLVGFLPPWNHLIKFLQIFTDSQNLDLPHLYNFTSPNLFPSDLPP